MRRMLRRKGRALLLVLILLCSLLPVFSAEAALRRGSKGDDVSAVQKRLKQWGYYDGAVDGIFGAATERAVKLFQKKNGLKVDGIIGSATAAAMCICWRSAFTANRAVSPIRDRSRSARWC